MLKVIVCDDDEVFIEKAVSIIKKAFTGEKAVADILTYTDSKTLLFDISDGLCADIAVLDIEMPECSGIDIVKELKKKSADCIVIFLTSHVKYAVESFEYDVFRYTPKYLMQEKLGEYISSALRILLQQEGQVLTIPYEKSVVRIPYKKIVSLTKEGKYVVVTDIDKRERRVRDTMNNVQSKLPPKEFIMTDRGCILNIAHISGIEHRDAICENGLKYPISRSRLKAVQKATTDYFGDLM